MSIAGSEYYDYHGNPPEVIKQKISPGLKLHTVPDEFLNNIDPVTYEVIRHRLWAIQDEMGETMKKMTGSIVVAECNDFNVGIMDEIGDVVQMGLYNTEVGAAMDMCTKWTLENRSDNPGIEDGDMFLTNDPWVGGGLHQWDECLFAPLFWEGELFCWTAASCHENDLGGPLGASSLPGADGVFWEPMPTPPFKMVKNGLFLRDQEEAWVRRSREPMLLALDLRAQMGANKMGQERILALIRRYGADTVKAVMKRVMNEAEQKLRAKLGALPDGTWSSFIYQEQEKTGDRGLYKILLTMTKKDNHLTFDFRGTDPQTATVINCTYGGLRGGVLAGVLPSLCGDIPWAPGGIYRCFDIISEKGTLNNCLFPAGIIFAPIGSAWASGLASIECISKMQNTKKESRATVIASCAGTWIMLLNAGLDERVSPPPVFVYNCLDPMAGGMGARTDQDGVDTGGLHLIPMGLIADVEMIEYTYPLLFLWRREEIDSGGPGKFRGGVSPSDCMITRDLNFPTQPVVIGSGMAVNMNQGLSGGYPGSHSMFVSLQETNIHDLFQKGVIPSSLEEIQSQKRTVLQCKDQSLLSPKDVFYFTWHGGGGYMDPILRDPGMVAYDVRELKVSPEAAGTLYGVVVDPKTFAIDEEGTKRARLKIIEERSKKARKPRLPEETSNHRLELQTTEKGFDVDENVTVVAEDGKRSLQCSHCGYVISTADNNYPDYLVFHEGPVSEGGPQLYPHPEHYLDAKVGFRQYYCPGCFKAFITQTVPVG
jgi:N-methylhydantoinase B